ncbi:YafY family protein [Nocardioides bigeumensis]|uniref:YafY family protein n=2 Tax=Nocardioides bigeumensis TaxID=433657 RepID=A0ABP5K7E9_9ACTN
MMSLLLQLQVRGELTGAELARLLEVSERTVQRDAKALADAGIPVRSTRGPAGGYRLGGGYRTRLTGIGLDEAGALAFLGLGAPAEQLGLGDLVEGLQTKIRAALTTEARDSAQRTADRFHLDNVRWFARPEPVPFLGPLAVAVWQDRRVRLDYERDGRSTRRTVDPLGPILASGEWYLVALRRGARRTYRVSRVRAVHPLDQAVSRPAGFDLAEDWRASRREIESEAMEVEVTLRARASSLPALRRVVPATRQHLVPTLVNEPHIELTVPFESRSWAVFALLGLGGGVEVLAPPWVRERVADQSRSAAAHYPAGPTLPG